MKYFRWGLPVAALVAVALWMTGCSAGEDTAHTEGLQYRLNEDGSGYSVTGIGKIEGTEVTIPSKYEGKPVTDIGSNAFRGRSDITDITIPDSVTHISQWAFSDCDGLTDITIPDSVTYIGRSAFEHCDGLVSVSLSDGLIGIDMNAFLLCPRLASITIPESVTEIGEGAFESCSGLTSITIPTGVTAIGVSAFYNTAYYKDETNWTDGMMYIGPALIACKEDKVGTVTIKDGTTCIADYAVAGTYRYGMISGCPGLTSIIIPDGVISIGECAFSDCTGLTSITIPDSVTSIGDYAFRGCSGLTSIMVAAGNTIYHATGNCLIETAGKTLMAGCKNSVIPTDGSVIVIGEYAFFHCTGLTTITIPVSVTEIGQAAFSGCASLASITIPVSVTGVGAEAFKGTAYYNTESNWVDDVLYIDAVLIDCKTDKTTSVSVKTGTVCVADEAFSCCAKLSRVTLPSSVKTIGELAFNECFALGTITYRGQKEQWEKVTRGERWNSNSGIKTINCSDGKIELGA